MPAASHLHHPLHFDLAAARHVPETHAWPDLDDRTVIANPTSPDKVPVIDISKPESTSLIGHACEQWGAFLVTGHGVSPRLLGRLEAQVERLFKLPAHDKLKAVRSPEATSGYGLPPISSFFSKFMWCEGFTVARSPHDIANDARKLWPDDYLEFCDVMEEYNKVMKQIAGRLLHLILLSMGLTEGQIQRAGLMQDFRDMSGTVHLNWYPRCPDPVRAIGLAPHTDSGLITVVHQNAVTGLQLLRPEDQCGPARWVTVPSVSGAFVVHLGDLLHILSNGRFKSVLHRAVVNRTMNRISVGYFCGPPAHVKVSPLQELMGPGRGPVYRAVTWPEYMGLRKKLFDKALLAIKVVEEEHNSKGIISGE